MKKSLLTLALLAIATPALAQQQAPASNVAVQISNAVGNMALELDQLRQANVDLQKQLAEARAKIKDTDSTGK